jgi:hypothetical protein
VICHGVNVSVELSCVCLFVVGFCLSFLFANLASFCYFLFTADSLFIIDVYLSFFCGRLFIPFSLDNY